MHSKPRRMVVAALACALALTGTLAALGGVALAKTKLTAKKTVLLPAKATKTINVTYPAALKYKNAKYSCAVKVTGLGRKNVKILSRGSALGGSVCRVKVRNNAKLPSLDTTAKVTVTATTTY